MLYAFVPFALDTVDFLYLHSLQYITRVRNKNDIKLQDALILAPQDTSMTR